MIAESEDLQDTINEDNKLLDEILAWANKRREKLADGDTQDIVGRRQEDLNDLGKRADKTKGDIGDLKD